MAENSFNEGRNHTVHVIWYRLLIVNPFAAVSKWIDDKTWPRSKGQLQSILVLVATNAGGTVFTIHSAFSYFEVILFFFRGGRRANGILMP